ncbi:MAG: LuxR C-terminal-related transcriptional regulator [Myxococcota bacterium]
MIRVAIASGHTLLRQGLAALLSHASDVEVVGQAGDPQTLRKEAEEQRPDVVLLDPRLPGDDVVETIRGVSELDGRVRILVVDRRSGSALGIRALRAGAHGLLDGQADLEELVTAIREVHEGRRHLPAATQATLAEMYLEPSEHASPADLLSEREFQVMCLLASGASSREAAERLSISVKTVDSHRGNLLKKLGLRNNADLARFALAHGYVEE